MVKKVVVEPDRILIPGKPDFSRCDNKVTTSRYTALSFLPVATMEQFRRFANMYFLIMGIIMAIGTYTEWFESAISPWTTLGPLLFVISVSLLVEGVADYKRHCNDEQTNNAPCVILKRTDEFVLEGPKAERDPHIVKGRDCVVNMNKAFYVDSAAAASVTAGTTPTAGSSSDHTTNTSNNQNNVRIAFQKVKRSEIRQGHFCLVKNREMVPADLVLLASSNDQGSAYIETSSIDGETNLKLRTSPHLPKEVLRQLRGESVQQLLQAVEEEEYHEPENGLVGGEQEDEQVLIETIDAAVKRITRFSYLGRPAGRSALLHPDYVRKHQKTTEDDGQEQKQDQGDKKTGVSWWQAIQNSAKSSYRALQRVCYPQPMDHGLPPGVVDDGRYVAALTTEPPNPSVHTFSGKLTLPPFDFGTTKATVATAANSSSAKTSTTAGSCDSGCHDIPLDADNVLLRGAVIRNTEWVIGVACFTGVDTKLVQNSFATKSKFSQLDVLMNKTVVAVLCIMVILITYLAALAVTETKSQFDTLFYLGFNKDQTEPWPYLPELDVPVWVTKPQNFFQYFFLFVTLLNNFIPLSLYVTIEMITFAMLWFVYVDLEMYDDTTNTRAVARSNIITDLGRIQYIFSDKTGTLTQNVMRFKRSSVDGLVFGAPIQKSRPGDTSHNETAAAAQAGLEGEVDEDEPTRFYPLRQLLVGQFKSPNGNSPATPTLAGLEGLGGSISSDAVTTTPKSSLTSPQAAKSASNTGSLLTFNSEMFLRVMSLCHTVVVEKDIDAKETIDSGVSVGSTSSSRKSFLMNFVPGNRKRADTGDSLTGGNRRRAGTNDSLPPVSEHREMVDFNGSDLASPRGRTMSGGSVQMAPDTGRSGGTAGADGGKGADGAPSGYAYQAESPDEGALVSAASMTYGFQVVSRDASGIRIKLSSPSHLQDPRLSDGLKTGSLTLKHLAAETASELTGDGEAADASALRDVMNQDSREEVWAILAVNKFDSDRKRMSILLRSPPELGGLPILFCKGADSSMLHPDICSAAQLLTVQDRTNDAGSLSTTPNSSNISKPLSIILRSVSEPQEETGDAVDEEGWEMAQVLGLQAHLGDFAREGLRTLVLGMRLLSESECSEWLEEYKKAATAMSGRAELLTKVAAKIETNIHIVGATAIEDKLQVRVPETIASLSRAGIKLWVLTGDKRETAVEIGYSTNVLTPKMHLTEVPDNGVAHVCTQMAMEFIRLIKLGRLVQYQKSALDDTGPPTMRNRFQSCAFSMGKCWRAFKRMLAFIYASLLLLFGCRSRAEDKFEVIKIEKEAESKKVQDLEMRRRVRDCAEKLIKDWLESDQGRAQRRVRGEDDDDVSLASEETPAVFARATSAKSLLKDLKSKGGMSQAQLREISLAALTVSQTGEDEPVVDEDALSLDSFFPGDKNDLQGQFDKKKRTILERLFANDREVRKGLLQKHVKSSRLLSIAEEQARSSSIQKSSPVGDGPRALVIEGAALKHLLGNPELEAILFAVASNCDAVIACRSSPKQKAELLNLVRHNVKPEPITLAIGDGANDVGMIQEAHVGVGISGKEGQQAVNASDFSIAQFRFLENLVLIHGRWNFLRLSTVVYFSFYKNALMAGILIIYSPFTLYSGTPLYDEWLIAMLNFVAAVPIIFLGLFDRFLSKEYVRNNPEVYKATRMNEIITLRSLFRWIFLVLLHIFTLFYFTVPAQSLGGGMTSAWDGLMRGKYVGQPGNGEGGDMKSVGTVTYTCMILLLAYKVLLESRSLVHGIWPAFTCRKDVGEGFFSRFAYTWYGVAIGSIGFYLFAIAVYGLLGRPGPSAFSSFTDLPTHMLTTRSLSWMLILFVPLIGIGFDMCVKVFANMYFPTQSQIHLEMESQIKEKRNKRRLLRRSSWRRTQQEEGQRQQEQRQQQRHEEP